MDDKILLQRITLDDRDAFDELIRRYYGTMKGFADSIVRSGDLAADIAQETFVRLWETRHKAAAIDSLKNYLYVSVRNIAVNHLRTERRLSERHGRIEFQEEDDGFWAAVIEEETIRLLNEAIEKLPPRSAMVLKLTLQGLPQQTIAAQMGVTLNTIKSTKAFAISYIKRTFAARDP